MASIAARQFRLGCFDVRNSTVVVADGSLPLAAEVDGASGAVIRVFTWPLSPRHRDRPVALSVLALGGSVLIASPAAGGIVQISRLTGETALIPLDADPGALLASADAVWAVASPGWREHATDEQVPARRGRRRAVLWEEPTADDVARHQELTRGFRFGSRPAQEADDDVIWPLADWRAAEGDDEDLGSATPIWHVRAGVARRIEADVQEPRLAEIGGRLAGVGRLPGDPIVKRLSPGGSSVSWRYPGTVIVLDEAGALDVIGAVPSSDYVTWADGGRVWLLGGDDDASDEPAPRAREVLLAEGQLAGSLDLRLRQPVAVIDGFVVDLGSRRAQGQPVVRFVPVDGGDPVEVRAPGADAWAEVRTGSGEVWFGTPGAGRLTVAAPATGSVRELRIDLDCRPWMAPPELPAGFDADQFEQAQLAALRGAFLGGWRGQQGDTRAFIEGVRFDAIDLRGAFPDCEVVAKFHASARPAVQFARRWPLYDELGNPREHQHAAIYLMEDVESGNPGLPPPGRCDPDQDGVVWF